VSDPGKPMFRLPAPISEEGRRILEQRAIEAEQYRAKAKQGRIDTWTRMFCDCIPPKYRMAAFGSEELAARVKSPMAIAATQRGLESTGIVWMGLSGSGKTSIACAAIRGRAVEEVSIAMHVGSNVRPTSMFVRASELAVASKHQSLGEGMPELVKQAISVDLLVIDELGSEPRSPHWTDVEDVVFARYEQDRATWYTTWTDADDITKRYGDGFARRVFEKSLVIDCGASK
jgi:DNA replication protein DnaC